MSNLIINAPEQLEGFSLSSENLLSDSSGFLGWLKQTKNLQENLLKNNTKFETREYQPYFAALYCLRKKNLCAGDLGIGKTLIAGYMIAAIYYDLKNRRPGSIQIICPTLSSGITRWRADLECISVLKNNIAIIRDEDDILKNDKPIWIYQMDFLKRKSKQCSKKSRAYYSRLLVLKDRRPSLLIADEIHNYREGTQRTKHLKYLKDRSKRFLGISGTLSDGEPELFSHLCRLVYKREWPYRVNDFARVFSIKKKVDSHYIYGDLETSEQVNNKRYLESIPVHRVPEYYEIFKRFVHRPTLNDPDVKSVCSFPTSESHFIKVKPSDRQLRMYRDVVNNNKDEYKRLIDYGGFKERAEAFSLIWPLISISSTPWVYGLELNKLPYLTELVNETLQANQKLVIFTGLNAVGHTLHRAFKSVYGINKVVRLYSRDENETPKELKEHHRIEVLDRLMFDKETQIGILSINLAGESIDLTSVHKTIFWDIPWNPITAYQAIRRLVRPGSVANHIDIYYLVSEGMIDEHQYNLLKQKLDCLEKMMDFSYESTIEISETRVNSVSPFSVLERIIGA